MLTANERVKSKYCYSFCCDWATRQSAMPPLRSHRWRRQQHKQPTKWLGSLIFFFPLLFEGHKKMFERKKKRENCYYCHGQTDKVFLFLLWHPSSFIYPVFQFSHFSLRFSKWLNTEKLFFWVQGHRKDAFLQPILLGKRPFFIHDMADVATKSDYFFWSRNPNRTNWTLSLQLWLDLSLGNSSKNENSK